MNKESMIDYLGELKKEYKITGSCDTELFCERLGLSVDELVGLLMGLFIIKSNDVVKCRDAYLQLERRNETLEEIIDARYENKNKKQTTLVKHGLPIAKKNGSLMEMKLCMKFGDTDKELMERFNISRTTLWRWKKELEKLEKEHKI